MFRLLTLLSSCISISFLSSRLEFINPCLLCLFLRFTRSPCVFISHSISCSLVSLTPLSLFPPSRLRLHTHSHTHSVLLALSDLPLSLPSLSPSCSLPLACPLSQLLWPLNITQAVSAKLWMSLDTYSTQTPFGTSICTEPISIFIVGRVGARVKPAVRISQSWRHRHKCPKQNYVCPCACVHVCVSLFVSLQGWLTHAWRLSEPTFWQFYLVS